ncbi:methyltransferase domain-containing protein [Candidatus Dojkabacteria bacterium]|nr:methyltransferase domain-containing protein [Candidatus Dojkabacteria bacterium]
MKATTINKLNNLNKKFYEAQAQSFSDTRKVHWPGWERVLDELGLQNKKDLKILDIGCGNGRFLQFLQDKEIEVQRYLGIDSSVELIKIAKDRYANRERIKFEVKDTLTEGGLESLTDKYDLVVLFGVMHHIPGFENRLKLLKDLAGKLDTEANLVVTLWQFRKSPRFDKMILPVDGFDFADDLEEGDYLLDWDKSGLPRYCHYFNDEEIEKLKKDLSEKGILTEVDFSADGKEGNLNSYLVLTNEGQ